MAGRRAPNFWAERTRVNEERNAAQIGTDPRIKKPLVIVYLRLKLAERVGFEPKFHPEAKSLENADLVDG